MQVGRKTVGVLVVLVLLLGSLSPALGVDPAPLERHIRRLRDGVRRLSPRSFERRLPGGRVERFRTTPRGFTYTLTDSTGKKIVAWSRSGSHQTSYEGWYTWPKTKERLLEDDRTISYTSYRPDGQKWEQYSFNKHKKLKSYDVYDKNGKLLP